MHVTGRVTRAPASALAAAPGVVAERGVVIFDLDGTLARIDHRRHLVECEPKRWREFYAACTGDTVNTPVARTWDAMQAYGYEMWIVSGRSDEVKEQTETWLRKNGIQPRVLLMREARDHQPDVKLKRSWLRDGTIPRERVVCVFDDRASVVAMWREEGITCFQVADGDF